MVPHRGLGLVCDASSLPLGKRLGFRTLFLTISCCAQRRQESTSVISLPTPVQISAHSPSAYVFQLDFLWGNRLCVGTTFTHSFGSFVLFYTCLARALCSLGIGFPAAVEEGEWR